MNTRKALYTAGTRVIGAIWGIMVVMAGYWAYEAYTAQGWHALPAILGVIGLGWAALAGLWMVEDIFRRRISRWYEMAGGNGVGWGVICCGLIGVNPWTMPAKMAACAFVACVLVELYASIYEADKAAKKAETERLIAQRRKEQRERLASHRKWVKDEYERIRWAEMVEEQEGKR